MAQNAHLDHKEALDLIAQRIKRFLRVRPEGDWADEAELDALRTRLLHRCLADTGADAVCHEDDLSVVGLDVLPALLIGLDRRVLLLEVIHVGVGADGVVGVPDDLLVLAGLAGADGPVIRVDVVLAHLGQLDGLDHLADGGVGANQNGMTIFLRQIEGQVGQIGVLLHARRCKNDGAVIAVAAAAGQLPVVALALEDVAQAGADTHDVRDDRRDVVTAEVRDAFLLQGEAGAGGSGQRTRAAAGRAEEHVDAGKLGLRLDELTADLLHAPGHILQNLRLRGDGIAAEETASSAKTGLCKGLIAFHQYFSHCFVTSLSFQNFDRVVRAHSVAAAAGDALFFIDLHGFIALLAKLTGRRERLDRAHAHAQVAALTPLGVQLDFFHRWINPPA